MSVVKSRRIRHFGRSVVLSLISRIHHANKEAIIVVFEHHSQHMCQYVEIVSYFLCERVHFTTNIFHFRSRKRDNTSFSRYSKERRLTQCTYMLM